MLPEDDTVLKPELTFHQESNLKRTRLAGLIFLGWDIFRCCSRKECNAGSSTSTFIRLAGQIPSSISLVSCFGGPESPITRRPEEEPEASGEDRFLIAGLVSCMLRFVLSESVFLISLVAIVEGLTS